MRPLLRTLAAVAMSILLASITPVTAAAKGQDISVGNSIIGTGVTLCGTTGGVPDPLGLKEIVVKNTSGSPVPGATVTINFNPCVSGGEIRLCAIQPDPGIAVSCAGRTVTAITDASGVARFHIVGYALNPGGGVFNTPAPGYGMYGAAVMADGINLGVLTVSAPDQNGAGGVDAIDLALFLNDRFSFNPGNPVATLRGRSDFNGDGAVGPVDLALWLKFRFGLGSTASCASVCP